MNDAMKRTVIGLLTLLLLFGLVKYFHWSSGSAETDPDKNKSTAPLNTNPSNPKNAGNDSPAQSHPEPMDDVPSDLLKIPIEQAIRDLEQRLTGDALKAALRDLGKRYGKEGLESAKEFILALPPGSIFNHALKGAVWELSVEELPGMVAWLPTREEDLGRSRVGEGIKDCIDKWTRSDVHRAVAFLADPDSVELPDLKRAEYISMALEPGIEISPIDIVAIAESLPPGDVRTRVTNNRPYIGARIKTDGAGSIISEILAQPDAEARDYGLYRLTGVTSRGDVDRAPILNCLLDQEFPEKAQYVSAITVSWLRGDTNAALEWLEESIDDAGLRDRVIADGWKAITWADPAAAEHWIMSMTPGRGRDAVVAAYDRFLSEQSHQ